MALSSFVFLILAQILSPPCLAAINIYNSIQFGFFRDQAQIIHYPIYYSLGYSGLHSKHFETALDLSISNDFATTLWRIQPTQALVTIPLTDGFQEAPFRKSRVELGRQLFFESFDVWILDGGRAQFYFTPSSGLVVYGGFVRVTDLYDDTWSPILGSTLFSEILGIQSRLGYSLRQYGLTDHALCLSLSRSFEALLFEPKIDLKGELVPTPLQLRQFHSELSLRLSEKWELQLSHSLLRPRTIAANRNLFIYDLLASSAEQIEQATLSWNPKPTWGLELLVRQIGFQSGQSYDWGTHVQLSAFTRQGSSHVLRPVLGWILSYGGRLWDFGLGYQYFFSDRVDLGVDAALARLDKINQIQGWVYLLRTTLRMALGARWSIGAWFELERNPRFDFDSRIFGSLTYFY